MILNAYDRTKQTNYPDISFINNGNRIVEKFNSNSVTRKESTNGGESANRMEQTNPIQCENR